MKYQQLTYEERITLSTLSQQGLSVRAIAVIMKRNPSTLYREFARNRYVLSSMERIDHQKPRDEREQGAAVLEGISITLPMTFYW